jgi:hypothetical protein
MPSMEKFLGPLNIIDAAVKSPLSPDFLVLLMPPALLHCSTIGRFSTSVIKFLEQRLSVHIKLSPLQDHGIPQERSVLVVVASPSCASLPWDSDWPVTSQEPSITIKDLIGDLAFENPRLTQIANNGFVCSGPAQSNLAPDESNGSTRYIYNHRTGRLPPPGKIPIDMDANAIQMSRNGPEDWIHPSKSLTSSLSSLSILILIF